MNIPDDGVNGDTTGNDTVLHHSQPAAGSMRCLKQLIKQMFSVACVSARGDCVIVVRKFESFLF